jgi:AcrR family transcriptional regulator
MMSAMTADRRAPETERSTGGSRGRPRSTEVDEAIAAAALDLIAEDGYAGMTMAGLAARAGVSTASLYRRFQNKDEVVLAALRHLNSSVPATDTGALESDLRALLTNRVQMLRGYGGRLLEGIVSETARNHELAQMLRSRLEIGRLDPVTQIVERAVARGEIPAPADPSLVSALVSGPLYWRLLVTGEPLTGRMVDGLVPLLVAALGARPQM